MRRPGRATANVARYAEAGNGAPAGGIGDVVSAGTLDPAVGELIVGVGLLGAGAVAFARERGGQ